MVKNWADGLTDEQKKAAAFKGTHARLLAGPGTGKTRTLTRRIVWLITTQGVSPGNILVLTFTRAAAAELRKNLRTALDGTGLKLPSVSTLHSFALREILRNQIKSKLPQPLRVADDYEENIIVEEIGKLIDKSKRETKDLLDQLSADWQKLVPETDPQWNKKFPHPGFLGALDEHRRIYGYTLRAELVYQLKTLLEEAGDGVKLSGPPKYILVDEYQDLNACDLSLIKSMAGRGSEIYSAGDDDQSIYGFRFANPEGIRRFLQEYNTKADFKLRLCQRCGKDILDCALHVAKRDIRRIDKDIEACKEVGLGDVHILRFDNQNREADGIANICSWLTRCAGIPPEQILILLRSDNSNCFSEPMIKVLAERGIEVQAASNPLAPLYTDDGREILCLMRLANNPHDHLAWRSILSLRNRGIGEQTQARLIEIARTDGIQYWDAIQKVKADPASVGKTGTAVSKAVTDIETTLAATEPPENGNLQKWTEDLAIKVINDLGARTLVVSLLLKIIEVSDSESLDEFLRAISVSANNQEQETEGGNVAIMTMHQAKGLSSEAVIVAAAEDEYVPGYAIGERIDDERRLLYVSLTRARKYLFVTYCNRRTGQQKFTGSKQGKSDRSFTRFLSGGPNPVENGEDFMKKLLAGS